MLSLVRSVGRDAANRLVHAYACGSGPPAPLRSPVGLPHLLNRRFCTDTKKLVSVTIINKDGSKVTVKEPVGTTILEVAHKNDLDIEGACEGACACSTCHVIVVDPAIYAKLPEPSDEENDMLDLAFGLTATSRLGCQIKLAEELDGMELQLPQATRNMAVDGYKAPKH
eukprot:gnl/Hemi2/4964_TR1720_c0_g1_i1.p1 gnl/Hemi2/4964_TR1720_c0_g1~~gnl/Hemi2/4964_TR1720_c0_g1_i1.p1  ORF type:complete len:169 (+),score=17.78 gnl/Hemi2/4964_TR1720_c0_g1_i1:27-533(+)